MSFNRFFTRALSSLLGLGMFVLAVNLPGFYGRPVEANSGDEPPQSPMIEQVAAGSSLLNNLVAYWALDETSGTRLDSVGSSHLTPLNAPGSGAGKLGNAAYFNSVSQQGLCAPSSAALEMGNVDYTITAWAYVNTSVPDLYVLVAKDNPSGVGRDYALQYYNYGSLNLMQFVVLNSASDSGNANSYGFANAPNPGLQQWVFLAARYKANLKQINISINGATAITATSPITPAISSAPLCLGQKVYAALPGYLNGRLDEVGIWKRVLNDEEVGQLYNFGEGLAYPFNPTLKTIGFKSDPQWKVYNTETELLADIPLGNAQRVCLNDSYPANCPNDAVRYGFNMGNGSGWLANISGLWGASWIWAPGITGATPNADLDEYFFAQKINVPGAPVLGKIKLAVDDLAEIRINGQSVDAYGSVTNVNSANQAQSQIKEINISAYLKRGDNTIVFRSQNGPQNFPPCFTPCSYIQNTAGIVFAGVIQYDPRSLASSSKTVSTATVIPGQTVTYTITLNNSSVITPAQALITDTLPFNLGYVTDSLTATSGTVSHSNGVVNWSGAVEANSSVTITYQAIVPITTSLGTVFTNVAVISNGSDTFTRTATLTLPLAKLYLPAVHRPQIGVLGRVTQNGQPASSVELQLRFFNGSSWSTWATTFSDGNGNFVFANPPTLSVGQKMYVRYLNSNGTPGRLYIWATADITAYQSGATVPIGQFDIADLNLVSPPNQTVVSLPYTFQWQARPTTPTDSYAVRYFGVQSGDDSFALTVPLGYVSSFRLTGLPPGFSTYTPYGWDVLVYSPNGGLGVPYYYRLVAFSNAGTSQLTAQMESQWLDANLVREDIER